MEMRTLLNLFILFYIINNVICIALAPSTVGDVIAGAGHLSYTIKVCYVIIFVCQSVYLFLII